MGKALEAVVAHRISYMAEIWLPKTLLGGQKIVSTEQAVHTLLEGIHGA